MTDVTSARPRTAPSPAGAPVASRRSTVRLEMGIAWRYLRSRRGSRLLSLISLIAIGGVVVGVSALILIIGVMNGLQEDLREKILIGSPDVRVLTFGEDLTMPAWRQTLERVRSQPGVVAAAPFVLSQAGVNTGHSYAEGAFIMGIVPRQPGVAEVTAIRDYGVSGDISFQTSGGDQRGVVLGSLMAARLGVNPGIPGSDSVNLIPISGAQFNAAIGGIIPRIERLEVTGIVRTGMYEYDNSHVFLSLETAQELAGIDTAVTGIEVRTTDRWSAPTVARALVDSLGYPFRTVDWQTQNQSLFQALKLEKLGMTIILLLIVIVAAFNIVSTLTMVVTDKTREIGILRAMGLSAKSVRRVFIIQGSFIGLVGTMLGTAIGLGGAIALERFKLIELDPSVYFIDHLPVSIQPADVALIMLASLGIAALATVYPAVQASRLYPVEAIRHE
ncbi:MAG: ABC transporter permease [Gemmatimonadaceae bacterium]|nr:ABC transporter permease [Gemmatimonadaceae bacterium]